MNKINRLIVCVLVIQFSSCDEDDFKPVPNPDFVYFLVEDPGGDGHNDSYILPLTNPDDIAQARLMIENPSEGKIITASITKNKSVNYYLNKDLNNDKRWSWHIAEFLGFYDNTIEIYDGWPQYVEDNYTEWVRITKGSGELGIIGFWGYRITKEVDSSELYSN